MSVKQGRSNSGSTGSRMARSCESQGTWPMPYTVWRLELGSWRRLSKANKEGSFRANKANPDLSASASEQVGWMRASGRAANRRRNVSISASELRCLRSCRGELDIPHTDFLFTERAFNMLANGLCRFCCFSRVFSRTGNCWPEEVEHPPVVRAAV